MGEIVSQGALEGTLADQSRGQVQLPVPVIRRFCDVGLDRPCTPLNAIALDEGCVSVQGGWMTRLMDTSCGLPLAVLPFISMPLSVICPEYVPGVKCEVSTLTTICCVCAGFITPP